MSRSDARELLMKLLFQMEAQNDYSRELESKFFSGNPKDKKQEKYLERMCGLISVNLTETDEFIRSCSAHWKIERMGKVDLAVMRVAVLEIMFMDDIPDSASINEAVDIAKKYGTEDSGKFVNGILGKVVRNKNAN